MVGLKLHALALNHFVWECPRCGWLFETDSDEPIRHVCGEAAAPLLGDLLEAYFTGRGWTKETYVAWKQKHGLGSGCWCDWRKRVLNAADQHGRDLVAGLKSFMGW